MENILETLKREREGWFLVKVSEPSDCTLQEGTATPFLALETQCYSLNVDRLREVYVLKASCSGRHYWEVHWTSGGGALWEVFRLFGMPQGGRACGTQDFSLLCLLLVMR
jgi:hypothetical protein